MTEADLAPLRRFMLDFLRLSDVNAAVLTSAALGNGPQGIGEILAQICAPGGEADTLSARLRNRQAARAYCREIRRTFAPFAAILRNTLPTGGYWTQPEYPSKKGRGAQPHKFHPGKPPSRPARSELHAQCGHNEKHHEQGDEQQGT